LVKIPVRFLSIIECAYPVLDIRPCKDTPFKIKINEIDKPFKTEPPENHTLSGCTSLLRPNKLRESLVYLPHIHLLFAWDHMMSFSFFKLPTLVGSPDAARKAAEKQQGPTILLRVIRMTWTEEDLPIRWIASFADMLREFAALKKFRS